MILRHCARCMKLSAGACAWVAHYRAVQPAADTHVHVLPRVLLCRVPEECPTTVEALVQRCLEYDPSARPTAREVVEVLRWASGSLMSHMWNPLRLQCTARHAPGW